VPNKLLATAAQSGLLAITPPTIVAQSIWQEFGTFEPLATWVRAAAFEARTYHDFMDNRDYPCTTSPFSSDENGEVFGG
jgi:hypothetical protein